MTTAFDSVPSFDGSPDDRQEKAASHCRLGARRGAEGIIWLVASQQLVQKANRGGPANLGGYWLPFASAAGVTRAARIERVRGRGWFFLRLDTAIVPVALNAV